MKDMTIIANKKIVNKETKLFLPFLSGLGSSAGGSSAGVFSGAPVSSSSPSRSSASGRGHLRPPLDDLRGA